METAAPIGEMLTSAGLISVGQVQTALYDQQFYEDMRLGEILVSRGWLRQETADFFGDVLQRDELDTSCFLLGELLLQAALLNRQQVKQILHEQRINHVRFGALAVLKGYISQRTLDFFLKRLYATQTNRNDYLQQNLRAAKQTLNQKHKSTRLQKDTLAEGVTSGATLSEHTVVQMSEVQMTEGHSQEVDINWIL